MSDKKTYTPLYRIIYNQLKEQIELGVWNEGDKIPTESEIMESFSVSRITASRALRDLSDDGYITRICRVGSIVNPTKNSTTAQNNYKSNLEQTNLSKCQTSNKRIAIIAPCAAEDGFNIFKSVPSSALQFQYTTSLYISHNSIQEENAILGQILNSDIAGVICVPVETYKNMNLYSRLLEGNKPVVFVDTKIPRLDIPCVTSDNFNAVYNVVQQLIEDGHRRIAFCCNTLSISTENDRFFGYLKCLQSKGIDQNNDYVYELYQNTTDENINATTQANTENINKMLKTLMELPEPPTALVCVSDIIAMIVQQQGALLGISIPEDLSITGFDNLYFCEHLMVPLTSVEQDFNCIGETAVQVLVDQINGKTVSVKTLIPTKIVNRKSVKKLV